MEQINEELIHEDKETSRYMVFLSEKGMYSEGDAFAQLIH